MPHTVVLVDGVGNGARFETPHKVLPVTLQAIGRSFVRTGEAAGDVPIFRLQGYHTGNRLPAMRHMNFVVRGEKAA